MTDIADDLDEKGVADELASPHKKIGRPTLYSPEFDEQVRKLSLLGLTVTQIARFFGVSLSCLMNWSRDYPSFRAAMHRGREIADAEVADALYTRAIGGRIKRKKVAISNTGVVTEHEYEEDVLPDVGAAQFWLGARHGQRWRAVQSLQHLDENGEPMRPPSVTVVGLDPMPPPAPES
jgi:hypothetical protein